MKKTKQKLTPLRQLPMSADFLFYNIFSDKNICRDFLADITFERITSVEFKTPATERYASAGKSAKPTFFPNGIYLEATTQLGRKFTAAIKNAGSRDIGREIRYCQSIIDLDALNENASPSKLPASLIVLFCNFNFAERGGKKGQANQNSPVWPVYRKCSALTPMVQLPYTDGTKVVLLNPFFDRRDIENINSIASYTVMDVLDMYMADDPVALPCAQYQAGLTRRIADRIKAVRSDPEKETAYMAMLMRESSCRCEAEAEGEARGVAKGQALKAVSTAKTMIRMGKYTVSEIAQISGLAEEAVKALIK